jgi:hypothetical protein
MAEQGPDSTLFVKCEEHQKPKRVLSPVSLSEDGKWRAYVEVDVRSDLGCVQTTRLWAAGEKLPYRQLYLIPPERYLAGNGMQILGWARNSRLVLMKTEQWQYGSDAPDRQRLLAIDAETGMVYEPELGAILQQRKDKQCAFRVTDAGFSADRNLKILVRVKLFTWIDEGDTEADVPPAKRCQNAEETWSFDFATAEIQQVGNEYPLQLFTKFMLNPRTKWSVDAA